MGELAAHIRHLGGLELEMLGYWELLSDRLSERLKDLVIKTGVRDKKFTLYDNKAAWEEVKRRVISRFPEVSDEEIPSFVRHIGP